MILLRQRRETARFHNPLLGGELDEQELEIRTDPLTGCQAVFNPGLEGKVGILFPDTDPQYLRERVEATEASCFLCQGRWQQTTPTYPVELLPEGRLVRGEAVLFPNLFPLSALHAVVMVGERHWRSLDDFPAPLLEDALGVSLDFLRRLHEVEPDQAYCTINANYLFPAGASVVHPHLQILGSTEPGTHHRLLLDRCLAWLDERGSTFWADLIDTERAGARWIGEHGSGAWLAAFAPLGPHEVQAVWPESRNLLDWDESDVRGLAEGLSAVLAAYHDIGLSTFNFSLYSGPLGGEAPGFRCLLRVVNRQNVHEHHRTDDYYFQKLLQNEIVLRQPEQLAALVRERFPGVSGEGGS